MRLGFLGPQGSFTELAAQKYQGQVTEYLAYQDIKSLIKGVKAGAVDGAVTPIENSLEGSVTLTLDLLVEFDLKIRNEIIIPIEHNLLVKNDINLEQIKHVISHPQALAQCRSFLEDNLVDYQVHTANSTSEAVKELKNLEDDWAAIGNARAARYYQLNLLKEGIQDNQENWTRFVMLAKADRSQTGNDKTSLICAAQMDRPGALYKILHEFAKRNINLTRIESRPAKKLLGDYIFFIDLEGHRADPRVKAALSAVKKMTSLYKLLGSYPKSTVIEDYLGIGK
ncbi:prephenate dehydratase [Halobacteroides halobius DSM 5150]|uniref:Prephenate dehydratase n=1 Tax=Halobacteroides halobius (strain ATCC 35273 / DSM 5150 / MD-1) TaxID=748449 RepID=L0K9U6_HALHC|nr:prephenate dehydratase [Halobacteroides halobius]AGB41776.1 prephenate dehydratase [Halobacteroides halobius DSM 5150]